MVQSEDERKLKKQVRKEEKRMAKLMKNVQDQESDEDDFDARDMLVKRQAALGKVNFGSSCDFGEFRDFCEFCNIGKVCVFVISMSLTVNVNFVIFVISTSLTVYVNFVI